MNKNQFTEIELAAAREEKDRRESRYKEYKKKWAADRYYANIDESRAKKAAYQRAWRAKNREKARGISNAANEKYRAENPATKRNSARKHNQKIREYIILFFGGKCVRCGFSDSRALQCDHINGDGYLERKDTTRGGAGLSLSYRYRLVKNDPEKARSIYQLLCANCNQIKRDENYEYSHSAKINLAIQDV